MPFEDIYWIWFTIKLFALLCFLRVLITLCIYSLSLSPISSINLVIVDFAYSSSFSELLRVVFILMMYSSICVTEDLWYRMLSIFSLNSSIDIVLWLLWLLIRHFTHRSGSPMQFYSKHIWIICSFGCLVHFCEDVIGFWNIIFILLIFVKYFIYQFC